MCGDLIKWVRSENMNVDLQLIDDVQTRSSWRIFHFLSGQRLAAVITVEGVSIK